MRDHTWCCCCSFVYIFVLWRWYFGISTCGLWIPIIRTYLIPGKQNIPNVIVLFRGFHQLSRQQLVSDFQGSWIIRPAVLGIHFCFCFFCATHDFRISMHGNRNSMMTRAFKTNVHASLRLIIKTVKPN
jgi:hypothetical protein